MSFYPPQPSSEPQSEAELLEKAQAIAGLSLAQLAEMAGVSVPDNLQKEKGWGGQLIEYHLGATAGSKPVPDFEHLGIELKTLPINQQGRVLETTFVCVAPLTGNIGQQWQTSHVCNKLKRVLWVPILAERTIPIADRIVGYPILWSPSDSEYNALKQDWEELMELICLGKVSEITAKHGQFLQLRPKAANAAIRTQAIGQDGEPIMSPPKGFYLKKDFTQAIINRWLG
ncbi:DNA mismatch repair endonuclease MutH [Catenovulum sp. SM1970]|uniref:DNA mismatch repair endonuclease MutH n=1 Tax=Marinifaba aquimaris TaxID=2741323 RepID=UPI00157196DB|nr:DNA mismatch repair endonuclease MutH [Marinifaba aquimaris]NTS75533.1 DNA mismatch repair endonuclease MutH [Marinifaba aquimaris]